MKCPSSCLVITVAWLAACSSDREAERTSEDASARTQDARSQPAAADTVATRDELLRLEREYLAAASGGEAANPELVASDAVVHNPDGSVQTGAQMVSDVASGAVKIESLRGDSLQVKLLGPDVALVSGRARLRGHAKMEGGGKAQDISGDYRFMDVWQRRGGSWRVVAEHATRIRSQ